MNGIHVRVETMVVFPTFLLRKCFGEATICFLCLRGQTGRKHEPCTQSSTNSSRLLPGREHLTTLLTSLQEGCQTKKTYAKGVSHNLEEWKTKRKRILRAGRGGSTWLRAKLNQLHIRGRCCFRHFHVDCFITSAIEV